MSYLHNILLDIHYSIKVSLLKDKEGIYIIWL